MRIIKIITAILSVTFLFGCATINGSSIVTGEVKPEISPDEVKIFLDPPAQYETIGLVEAAREIGGSRQKTQDLVIEDLKKLAAKLGANGVLLTSSGTQLAGGSTGGFSVGFGNAVGNAVSNIAFGVGVGNGSDISEKITGQGRAIYVIAVSAPPPTADTE